MRKNRVPGGIWLVLIGLVQWLMFAAAAQSTGVHGWVDVGAVLCAVAELLGALSILGWALQPSPTEVRA